MKKLLSSMLILTVSFAVVAFPSSQDPSAAAKPQSVSTSLTNKDILDMVKAGLTADVIVAKVKSSATSFDTSPTILTELKTAGVPDAVILAMVDRPSSGTPIEVPADGIANVPDGTEVEIQLTNNASGEEM